MSDPQQLIHPGQTSSLACYDSGLSINDMPPTQLWPPAQPTPTNLQTHLPNTSQKPNSFQCAIATLMSQMANITTYLLSKSDDPIVPHRNPTRPLPTCCLFFLSCHSDTVQPSSLYPLLACMISDHLSIPLPLDAMPIQLLFQYLC